MKISELQELLEKAKEEYGDIRVGIYNHKMFMVIPVEGVDVHWDADDLYYVEIG